MTDKRNQKILERVGRKASIGEGLSPHKLRHTFATLSLKYGSNLEYIRMMLGRTDIRTASQAYLHVASADLAEASKHTSPIINLGIGKGKSPIKPATDKKAPLTEQTIVVQVKPFKPDLETGNRSGFL